MVMTGGLLGAEPGTIQSHRGRALALAATLVQRMGCLSNFLHTYNGFHIYTHISYDSINVKSLVETTKPADKPRSKLDVLRGLLSVQAPKVPQTIFRGSAQESSSRALWPS